MKVYVLLRCAREGWQSIDEPAIRRDIVGVFSDCTTPRTHVAGVHLPFGQHFAIDEYEVDAPCDTPARPRVTEFEQSHVCRPPQGRRRAGGRRR